MAKKQSVKNKDDKKSNKRIKKVNKRKVKSKIKKVNKRVLPKNNTKEQKNILKTKRNEFPNLKFKANIIQHKSDEPIYYRLIDVFAVFTLYKDKKPYIALNNENSIDIDIIELLNDKKMKTLKSHKYRLKILEYYINLKNTNKEYLISIDCVNNLNIWDINNNYQLILKIIETCDHLMVTCLLFFPLGSEKDYIITPKHDCDEKGSKIYSFKTGQLIKYFDVGYNYANTILSWYNKIDKKDYIIQICEMKI